MISYNKTIRDRAGNVIAGATVTVYIASTPDKADLFLDAGGSEAAPNPVTSSSNGLISFYVDAGAYDLTVAKGNFTDTIPGITLDAVIPVDLSADTGATLVGTDNGDTLQERLDTIDAGLANSQPLDATLTALAGVTTAGDTLIYADGRDSFLATVFTPAARDLLDDASASDMRTTLGLAIGTNVQAYDADLAAIAGLTSAADKGIQFTGTGTAATYDLTTAGKALLDDANAAAQLVTLGGTTVGAAFFGLANPSAIRFPRINADNSVSSLDASAFRTAIGAGSATGDVVGPASATADRIATYDGTTGKLIKDGGKTIAEARTHCIPIACSDEGTALTAGTAKVTFRMPYAFTLTDVRASVTTAPTGGTLLTVDVNEAGSTILSTKLTFDASEKTTTTAATPRVISDSSLADDAEITIDIDAVGSTIAGAGLKVYLIGYPT